MTYKYFTMLVSEYINNGSNTEKLLGEIGYPADLDLEPEQLIKTVDIVAAAADGNIKKLIDISGISAAAFSREYAIPYRTIQDWCSGQRRPVEYIPRMIAYAMIGNM